MNSGEIRLRFPLAPPAYHPRSVAEWDTPPGVRRGTPPRCSFGGWQVCEIQPFHITAQIIFVNAFERPHIVSYIRPHAFNCHISRVHAVCWLAFVADHRDQAEVHLFSPAF